MTWIGRHFTDANERREEFLQSMRRIELHERALLAALLDVSSLRPCAFNAAKGVKSCHVRDQPAVGRCGALRVIPRGS